MELPSSIHPSLKLTSFLLPSLEPPSFFFPGLETPCSLRLQHRATELPQSIHEAHSSLSSLDPGAASDHWDELPQSQSGATELPPSQPRAIELPPSQPGTAEPPSSRPGTAELSPQPKATELSQSSSSWTMKPHLTTWSCVMLCSREPPTSIGASLETTMSFHPAVLSHRACTVGCFIFNLFSPILSSRSDSHYFIHLMKFGA